MSLELKADGNWGEVTSSEADKSDEKDPIQQAILQLEEYIKNGVSEKIINTQEKKIWDMIYRKRMLS